MFYIRHWALYYYYFFFNFIFSICMKGFLVGRISRWRLKMIRSISGRSCTHTFRVHVSVSTTHVNTRRREFVIWNSLSRFAFAADSRIVYFKMRKRLKPKVEITQECRLKWSTHFFLHLLLIFFLIISMSMASHIPHVNSFIHDRENFPYFLSSIICIF